MFILDPHFLKYPIFGTGEENYWSQFRKNYRTFYPNICH